MFASARLRRSSRCRACTCRHGSSKNIRLPEGISALPGPVRLWPYQREIADAISARRSCSCQPNPIAAHTGRERTYTAAFCFVGYFVGRKIGRTKKAIKNEAVTVKLAVPRGVEPPTFGLGNRCSNQLNCQPRA